MTTMFDTYQYVKELRKVGVPEEQAEVHAKALVKSVMDSVASKADISELKAAVAADIAELKAAVAADIAELKAAVAADIINLEKRMEAGFAEGDKRFAVVETKLVMMQWALGLIFGMNVAMFLKLFWPH